MPLNLRKATESKERRGAHVLAGKFERAACASRACARGQNSKTFRTEQTAGAGGATRYLAAKTALLEKHNIYQLVFHKAFRQARRASPSVAATRQKVSHTNFAPERQHAQEYSFKTICELLPFNTKLKVLNLHNNNAFGNLPKGGQQLGQALKNNKSLKHFSVSLYDAITVPNKRGVTYAGNPSTLLGTGMGHSESSSRKLAAQWRHHHAAEHGNIPETEGAFVQVAHEPEPFSRVHRTNRHVLPRRRDI